MKFELSDDQALLRSSTRDFLARACPFEASRKTMEHDPRGYDPALWRGLAEMGYLGLTVPAQAGGQGLGTIELAVQTDPTTEEGNPCHEIAAAHLLIEMAKNGEAIDASGRPICTLLISHYTPAALGQMAGFSAQPEYLANPFTPEALLERRARLVGRGYARHA